MTPGEYDANWICAVCGDVKVVPSLARACEAKHQQETAPVKAGGDESTEGRTADALVESRRHRG
jgi:hypothetical protein